MKVDKVETSESPWVAIIGAGVSGLSLAANLARYPELPGEVILYDPHLDRAFNKTFCFWYEREEDLMIRPEHNWERWSFSHQDVTLTHQGGRFKYGMISGAHFRSVMLEKVRAHPQIRMEAREITGSLDAEHVFDSRPPSVDHFRVKQSFVGLEVKLSRPHGLSHVQLMHDLNATELGLEFRYALPLSSDRLLVEYTRFTPSISDLSSLEADCHQWLRERYDSYEVERREMAHIPMGLSGRESHLGIPIGARAGMTRDSTGYGFIEMNTWAKQTASRLVKHQRISVYKAPVMRRWMDSCLLKIIEARPDYLPRLFMTLSQHLSGDQFASFMMRCDLSDAIRVMLIAPKRPFLLSALGKPELI